MKFKLYENYLKESDSPVLDDLIDLGLTKDQATRVIKYFAPRLQGNNINTVSKPEKYDIEEITLLSMEEAYRVPDRVSMLEDESWWWLQTPGEDDGSVAVVGKDGWVYENGEPVTNTSGQVRPALRISNLASFGVRIYDTITIFDVDWIVIDRDLVLLDGVLGHRRFDAYDNDYEISEIRKYLEDWLKDQKRKFSY